MIYQKIVSGKFLERPNRFIAYVEIDGIIEKVHVKDTSRCTELLIPGVEVILEDCSHIKTRKTKYSLIAVYKNGYLINTDSQAPNKVVLESLLEKKISGLENITNIKPEKTYKNSRFDFYFEKDGIPSFLEVKGVTLEENTICKFPGSPTKRGTKHLLELIDAKANGYNAYVLFLVKMDYVNTMVPFTEMDPVFSETLTLAYKTGVKILAYNCSVKENMLNLLNEIEITLDFLD